MNSSRRSFLRKSAFGLGAIAIASPALQSLAAAKYKKLVAIQLYSVRAEMKADPMGTLTKLAEMGYKYVEHANYINRKFYGWEAKEFKKRLDDLGMKMLQELVFEYNKYNEVLEARKTLMEVANKMGNIGELSEAYLVEKLHEDNKDENAWFDETTIRKHTNEIKKMTTEFKKMAAECDESMRKMQGLYQECGMMLERYFHME